MTMFRPLDLAYLTGLLLASPYLLYRMLTSGRYRRAPLALVLGAVPRALAAERPRLLVLAEGELWPNMLRAAKGRGVTVAVINGRLSPRSARRYQRLAALAQPMLQRVDLFAV